MRITGLKLNDFLCFYFARSLELQRRISLVVGKNNSGKTALVRALASDPNLKCPADIGHSSVHSLVASSGQLPVVGTNNYEITYSFEFRELLSILIRVFDWHSIPVPVDPNADIENAVYEFLSDGFALSCTYIAGRSPNVTVHRLETARPENTDDHIPVTYIKISGDYQVQIGPCVGTIPFLNVEHLWQRIVEDIPKLIFKFDAERRVATRGEATREMRLAPDSSNLAQVLFTLKNSKPQRFRKYLNAIQTVLPEIHDVLTIPSPHTEVPGVEICIDFGEGQEDFEILRRPLDDCGTGIGQILAMLYVVIESDAPSVILIEEPQSFLHPDAERKLLQIFQSDTHSRHQYVITTHSPTAILSVQEGTLILIERDNMISDIRAISSSNVDDIRKTLRSVGARLSDVFGMDSIIWVEGETDEECFPMILTANKVPLLGSRILRIAHTGDFTDKSLGASAVKLYRRLSHGNALLPPALAFVFDSDMEAKLDPIRAELGSQVKLLPRQNYESYLIVPNILADILNRDAADDKPKNHTADSVTQWIREKENRDFDDPQWLKSVDGAKLLDRMFQEMAGVSYNGNKVTYGEEITKRILADNPNHFQEIVDLIKSILEKVTQPDTT